MTICASVPVSSRSRSARRGHRGTWCGCEDHRAVARRFNRRSFLFAVAAGVGGVALFDELVNFGGSPGSPDHRVWSRIEAWMDAHAPEASEVLHPGINDDSIERAERSSNSNCPSRFRRSLARHDGQEVRWPSLVEFGFLMPLQQGS